MTKQSWSGFLLNLAGFYFLTILSIQAKAGEAWVSPARAEHRSFSSVLSNGPETFLKFFWYPGDGWGRQRSPRRFAEHGSYRWPLKV